MATADENPMASELFEQVQEPQGYAYISDGMGDYTDERVLAVAKFSLRYTVETAKRLRQFIRKHERRLGK